MVGLEVDEFRKVDNHVGLAHDFLRITWCPKDLNCIHVFTFFYHAITGDIWQDLFGTLSGKASTFESTQSKDGG